MHSRKRRPIHQAAPKWGLLREGRQRAVVFDII
jgi:hypothetical protein